MKVLILLFTLLLVWTVSHAQYLPADIPVTKKGIALVNPWAGGLDAPQYSTLDLNNDGILDLLVFDRLTEVSNVYINRGTAGQVDYEHAPSYSRLLPQQTNRSFLLARDYNGDGISDLFGLREVFGLGIKLSVWKGYRNADDSLRFRLEVANVTLDRSDSGGSRALELYVYRTDLPGIGDVDGDGDIDIFAFQSSFEFPTNIAFYENRAVDNGHGLDTLEFYMGSECWGLMSEELDSAKVYFGPSPDSCYRNPYFNNLTRTPYQLQQHIRNSRAPRHMGGTNITLVDYNGDSSMDVVLSEVDFRNANLLTSTTVNDTVWMISEQAQYPMYDKPIDIYGFAGVYFLDVNNDGAEDMLVSPSDLVDGNSVTDSVTWWYKNTGSTANMVFDFQQKDFLVESMIDVGRRAHPALVDYNGDGLQDLLIGGHGRVQENTLYKYGMVLYQNIGTATKPAFEWVTDNFAQFDSLKLKELYPTFGDLDGDGDLDMICGEKDGTLVYFENIAGVNQTLRFATPILNFSNINTISRSAPQLVDLDRDGDLDLVIGGVSGFIYYYENTGTNSNAVFSSTATSTNLGNNQANYPNARYVTPFVYDNQGHYELLIGQEKGPFIHLDSIDNNVLGTYPIRSTMFKDFFVGQYTQIAVTNINNDGKKEYLIGTGAGGVIFMNEVDSFISSTALNTEVSTVRLFPNPAQETVMLDFQKTLQSPLQLTVFNALGQALKQEQVSVGRSQQQLSLKGLPSGILFIEIQSDGYRETLQLVKH